MKGAIGEKRNWGLLQSLFNKHLLNGRHCAELCNYSSDPDVFPTVTEFSECNRKAIKDTGSVLSGHIWGPTAGHLFGKP